MWAHNNDIQSASLKGVTSDLADGMYLLPEVNSLSPLLRRKARPTYQGYGFVRNFPADCAAQLQWSLFGRMWGW